MSPRKSSHMQTKKQWYYLKLKKVVVDWYLCYFFYFESSFSIVFFWYLSWNYIYIYINISIGMDSFLFLSPSTDKLPNCYSPVCSVFTMTLWDWYMSLPHWPARKHMATRTCDNEYKRIKGIISKQLLLQLSQRANFGVGNIPFPTVLEVFFFMA